MDISIVDQLSRQWHSWVAKYGRDKRWRHLSVKPTSRWDFPIRKYIRPLKDDKVDRSGVQAWWHVQRTDTNRSKTWPEAVETWKRRRALLLSSFEWSWKRHLKKRRSGGDSMMDTPVPIPNTEVKHHNGDDSTYVQQ